MSTDRDTTRIVRSWLRTDEYESADRVLDAVLDQLDTTPQRRVTWWPVRRFPEMNTTVRIALAAAAIFIVAIVGTSILMSGENVGGPGGTPGPSPTSTSTPQPLGNGPLDSGTVVASPHDSITVYFTVPEGWEGFSETCILPVTGTTAPDGMGICFLEVIGGLYSDPCHPSSQADIPIGPSVDEFANALTEQTAYEATTPTDVTLGGYPGKRVDLQLPTDVDSCGEFYPWNGSIYAQGPDNQWQVWILDVDGTRFVIVSSFFPGTTAEDRAEQQAIVDSMRIEP
jgi:hypothetical protein